MKVMQPEPVATYRVQLTSAFDLYAAAEIIPYLAALGIDHLYTSPSQQAVVGSTNGYDVTDPTRVNRELGGAEGHHHLSGKLADLGMRRMLDIVPNHMAITGGDNPWWNDVMRHGKSSRHAAWFDVDWDASDALWPNRVLLPVLGDQFGRELEAGNFRLSHREGEFTLHYGDGTYPVEPSSTAVMLERVADRFGHAMLGFVAESLMRLPRPSAALDSLVARRHRNQAVLAELLRRLCMEEPEITSGITAEVERMNGNLRELGELIEGQNYRLAHWRAADLDLGYRRFFNINALAGLCVELPEVFNAVHALPLQWIGEGSVHALRVDHPDGLRDPGEYLQRLRRAAPGAWIVVEKILEPGERLPPDWPVEGTTGYDFANLVQGLFVDPDGEEPLTACYRHFTGNEQNFEDILLASKRLVLSELLGSEMARLTSQLREICEHHWRHRDHTRAVLTQALTEIAAGFRVYRSYVRPGREVVAEDEEHIRAAVEFARGANPLLDEELLQFVERLLLMNTHTPADAGGTLEIAFAQRFQQLTGPTMAKGLEDTAFYRYFRLTALNEVGGSPSDWGCSVEAFHDACKEAGLVRPYALLTTSTHDTKRSEDVRARLLVLSEIPAAWSAACRRWRTYNARHRAERVDANTEYLYYQTLVGAWPIDAGRAGAYMEKAVREAREHTGWTHIDADYESALQQFITATLADADFIAQLEAFVADILLPGRINSLAQTLLKLTAPGVPDIYQGCELWDLSLVDPDNRRPVDFALRAALLQELDMLEPAAIAARMDEGLPKLWVIRQALRLRGEHPGWFGAASDYEPLAAEGEAAEHVVAFIRGGCAITVVPRLTAKLRRKHADTGALWRSTVLKLPPGTWRNCLDPQQKFVNTAELDRLFSVMPVALLIKEAEGE